MMFIEEIVDDLKKAIDPEQKRLEWGEMKYADAQTKRMRKELYEQACSIGVKGRDAIDLAMEWEKNNLFDEPVLVSVFKTWPEDGRFVLGQLISAIDLLFDNNMPMIRTAHGLQLLGMRMAIVQAMIDKGWR